MFESPYVRRSWIVHEDSRLIVVDKPAGLPCLPLGEPQIALDLATRLSLASASPAAAAPGPPVKTPDPIDRESSGLVAFARTKEASAALSRVAEAKRIVREHVAVVVGPVPDRAELSGFVVKEHGRFVVSARPRAKALAARTRLRVLERVADRALVSLEIVEGRPLQLRAQLAAAGYPIAGDAGVGAAARLMLHARALDLGPDFGAVRRFEAPVPEEMARFLASGTSAPETRVDLDRALERAIDARLLLARSADDEDLGASGGVGPTTAFRLLAEERDGVPGLAVDVYGAHLVAHIHADKLALEEDVILDALAALGAAGVYVKRRPKQANEVGDTRRDEVAPAHAVRGADAAEEIVVLEDGVPYLARLGDGLSTGIFLDQRENRARVRGWASGASLLNLFSYTCPFTVAAAVGGAVRTLSVDASAPALAWGERNVQNARARASGTHRFEQGDAFEVLERLAASGERFDLVVVDPPTYSTTRASRWTSGKDWEGLGVLALRVTAPGGRLLACSNDRRTSDRALERHLVRAADRARVRVARVERLPPPPEHARGYSKTVVITLA